MGVGGVQWSRVKEGGQPAIRVLLDIVAEDAHTSNDQAENDGTRRGIIGGQPELKFH